MKIDPSIHPWLNGVIIVSAAMTIALIMLIIFNPYIDSTNSLKFWTLYFSGFKFILGGFLVALLLLLIPLGLSEARLSFERRKESLSAFSHAKTGVDYLNMRLCVLTLKEAGVLIQETHLWKHQAELYDLELADHLKIREETMGQRKWADLLFKQLHAARKTLEKNSANWDSIGPQDRLAKLDEARESAFKDWEKETGLQRP